MALRVESSDRACAFRVSRPLVLTAPARQVWPGQTMEWEIEDPAADGRRSPDEPDANWNSTLRLTLPRLGGIEARLHLTPAGVAMRLIADSDETRATLAAAEARLADALAAADVPLTGLVAELRGTP